MEWKINLSSSAAHWFIFRVIVQWDLLSLSLLSLLLCPLKQKNTLKTGQKSTIMTFLIHNVQPKPKRILPPTHTHTHASCKSIHWCDCHRPKYLHRLRCFKDRDIRMCTLRAPSSISQSACSWANLPAPNKMSCTPAAEQMFCCMSVYGVWQALNVLMVSHCWVWFMFLASSGQQCFAQEAKLLSVVLFVGLFEVKCYSGHDLDQMIIPHNKSVYP